MLIEVVRRFCGDLNNRLHSSIKDAETIHIVAFASFLEAALNSKGKLAAYEDYLDRIKDSIKLQSARAGVTKLSLPALAVVKEAEKSISKATLDKEASVKHIIKEAKESYQGRIDSILVVDAFSLIEFSSLIVTARRNGFACEISEQVFVNPPSITRFVQEQVRGENLINYAKELAKEIRAAEHHVFPLFDQALHHIPGDVLSFLSGSEKNPFELVWEKGMEYLSKPRLFPFTLLITSDHGYNVFEENEVLWVGHGRGERALLDLGRSSLFILLTKKGFQYE